MVITKILPLYGTKAENIVSKQQDRATYICIKKL